MSDYMIQKADNQIEAGLEEQKTLQQLWSEEWDSLELKIEKLQEQNKSMRELLKEADSIIDDYLNWRSDKRMDYFDTRARKFREALKKLVDNENN